MNVNVNANNSIVPYNPRAGQSLGQTRNPIGVRVRPVNHSNGYNENTEYDRNEFIRSFHLNISTSSSPILVRNPE